MSSFMNLSLGKTSDRIIGPARDLDLTPGGPVAGVHSLPDAVGEAVEEILPALSSSAKLLADRLHKFVLTSTKKTAARLMT
jgi:hypothetical protein